MQIGLDAKRAFYNNTGLGNYGRGLIHSLSDYQPDIDLHFYAPKRKDIIEESILNLGNTHYLKGPLKNFNRFFNLSTKIKKQKLDIYHGLSNELPLKISKAGVKSVVTIHDIIFLKLPQYYKPVDRKIYYYKTLYAVQNADLIITTSKQTLNDLENEFGCGNKCITIYQHLHAHSLPTLNQDQALKNMGEYFIYVSSFEKRKNHLTLIKAFSEISNQTDKKLVLVGRKKETFEKCQLLIKELNLENRIITYADATQSLLNTLLANAAAFIYPSLYEGFGIPLLEAMSKGLPIACAKIPVFEEIAQKSAIYFDPLSVNELKKALILIENKSETEKFKKFINEILPEFSAQKHALSLANAYQSVF